AFVQASYLWLTASLRPPPAHSRRNFVAFALRTTSISGTPHEKAITASRPGRPVPAPLRARGFISLRSVLSPTVFPGGRATPGGLHTSPSRTARNGVFPARRRAGGQLHRSRALGHYRQSKPAGASIALARGRTGANHRA